MEKKKYKPTITINVSDIKLRIIRIGKNTEIGIWEVDEKEIVPHTHFTHEVFFVTNGRLPIKTGEKRIIYERKIVIIPPDVEHFTAPNDTGCYCVLLAIEKPKGNDAKYKYLTNILNQGICELELSDDVIHYIRTFARKSEENSAYSEKDAALLAELIFREIIALLIPATASDSKKPESWYVGTIETYINAHIKGRITLSDIAEHMYLSTRQVSRIIMREFGMPLSELVCEKKLRSAKMLLKNSDMKIKEIASKVNLGGENYFYALFKKRYGMTPLEYRKNHMENIDK